MTARINDVRELNAKYNRGELAAYRGEYVIFYRGEIVNHGPDLSTVRKSAAAQLGVPQTHLTTTFVYG